MKPRRARSWPALFAATLLFSAIGTLALAQPGDGEAFVYELRQGGAVLGEVGIDMERGSDGYLSESYVELPGLLTLNDVLVTGPDGAALSYELSGTVRGIAIAMTADFHDGGASFHLTQAGQEAEFDLASDEPLYVVDNNFLDGFQVIAYEAVRRGEPMDVAAVVPQGGAIGRVAAQLRSATERVDIGANEVEARGLDVVLTVGPQQIAAVAWLDDSGTILALDQPLGGIRFEQVTPGTDGVDGSPGRPAGGPGQEAAETAEELLARTASCVETRGLDIESTGASLYGLLSLPVERPARGAPTLVLLPGSGPTDVAGNSPPLITNSGYEQVANLLGCAGYGVLRVAKLGIPPSTGDANAVSLDTYVQNTADWLVGLADTDGVDAGRLGLIGHSEGGLIALEATASGAVDVDVLVLIAAPGVTMGDLIRAQFIESARRSGFDETSVAAIVDDVDELLEAIRTSEGSRLELTGGLADNQVAPAFAPVAGLLRSEIDVDPVELAEQVEVPTLVIHGLKDVQVVPENGRALAGALHDVLLLEPPDLTHNLVDTRLPAEALPLPGPDATVSDTMIRALVTFLNGTLKLAN